MVVRFFDSGALAGRYVAETVTARARSLTGAAAGNGVYVARITHTRR